MRHSAAQTKALGQTVRSSWSGASFNFDSIPQLRSELNCRSMRMKKEGYTVGFLILAVVVFPSAQNGPQSTTGTRFYFSFDDIRDHVEAMIYITTPESHAVDFSVRTGNGYQFNGSVDSHSTYKMTFSDNHLTMNAGERNKGIVLWSADETSRLTVMGAYTHSETAESFTVFPNYVFPTYTYYLVSTVFIQPIPTEYQGFLLLTGTETGTDITLTPTQTVSIPEDLTDNDCPEMLEPGSSCTFTLHELETLLLRNERDLTGTKITSTKPLAVFSGHECAHVPVGIGGCEPLVEQIPPVLTWGKTFLVNSFANRVTGEWFKVLAAEGSTAVKVHCVRYEDTSAHSEFSIQLFEEGNDHDFFIANNRSCSIEADKPVLLMLLAPNELNEPLTDGAFMALVPPMEQYNNDYSLSTVHNGSYVSITMLPEFCPNGLCQLTINETMIHADFLPIYCSIDRVCGYALTFKLPIGTHRITHVHPDATFGVISYTFDTKWGYGTVTGMSLNQVVAHPPDVSISQDPPTEGNTPLPTGTRLTLTCTITTERLNDDIVISGKWLKQGEVIAQSPLSTEDGLTYVLEHTFNSLSTSDRSTYTCEASLTSPYAGLLATASTSTSILAGADYSFFQLGLEGVKRCSDWLLSETETKAELLREEVAELIETKCGCSYSSTFISSPVLQCPTLDPDTANEVTFRARVQDGGDSPLSSAAVISYLEESRDSALAIQGLLLTVSSDCDMSIENLNDPLCSDTTSTPSVGANMNSEDDGGVNMIIVSGVLGFVVVLLMILLIVVVVLVGVVVSSRHKSLRPKSIHIHQVSGESTFSLGSGDGRHNNYSSPSSLQSPVSKTFSNGFPAPDMQPEKRDLALDRLLPSTSVSNV